MKVFSWPYFVALTVLFVLMFVPNLIPERSYETPLFLALNRAFSALPPIVWLGMTAIATIAAVWIVPLTALRPRLFNLFAVSGLVATGLTYLFKFLAGRSLLRPPAILDHSTFQIIGEAFSRSSMPSGHTVSGFLLALWCIQVWPQKRTWFFGLAILIGLSRIACGVHWPSDVVAGAILSILSFYAVKAAYTRLSAWAWPRWVRQLTTLGVFITFVVVLVGFLKNRPENTEEWIARAYAGVAFLSGAVIAYWRYVRPKLLGQ